jgi:hypothetical protein
MKEPTLSTRGQIAVLAGVVLLFVGVIAVAPYLEQSPLANTDKKLRAKAGMEREGARALVSDTTSATPAEQRRGTRETPLSGWDAPKNWDRLRNLAAGDGGAAGPNAAEYHGLTPAQNIARLEAELPGLQSVEAISAQYATLGRLYAHSDPPELVKAAEAYDLAAQMATRDEDRHVIVHSRIEALHQQSDPRAILDLIEQVVHPGDTATLLILELDILRGAALERLEQTDEAADVYRRVMAQAWPWEGADQGHAEQVCRQAALRLARLYRSSGRAAEAEAVARDVRKLLEP